MKKELKIRYAAAKTTKVGLPSVSWHSRTGYKMHNVKVFVFDGSDDFKGSILPFDRLEAVCRYVKRSQLWLERSRIRSKEIIAENAEKAYLASDSC